MKGRILESENRVQMTVLLTTNQMTQLLCKLSTPLLCSPAEQVEVRVEGGHLRQLAWFLANDTGSVNISSRLPNQQPTHTPQLVLEHMGSVGRRAEMLGARP